MADIKREQRDDHETLTFSGELTVQHAATIVDALHEAVLRSAVIEIVIAGVTAADVTFPQAVCAAHRTAAALNKTVTVRGEGEEPLGSVLRSAGFLRHIGCQGSTRKSCLWLAC